MANTVVLGDLLRETLFRRTHIRIWELNTLTCTETQTVGGALEIAQAAERKKTLIRVEIKNKPVFPLSLFRCINRLSPFS
jgi:hypothetical protein